MPRRQALAIVGGGMLGAVVRWAVLTTVTAAGLMPWPVLLLNVAGSFVLGVLLAEEWKHPRARLLLHDVGGIGFCGGMTTFATFSLDVVRLVEDRAVAIAGLYALLSVVLSVGGVVAGAALFRRVRAVELPLEEAP